VEILAGLTIESDQVHDQASAFTDPKASVKEEQDQQVISKRCLVGFPGPLR
jgi:hypothetical protein